MKKNAFLYLATTSMISALLFMPADSFAANYYNNNYNYNNSYTTNGSTVDSNGGYYDSNGYYFDGNGYYDSYGNYYPLEQVDETAKDTSWFDYENPKKIYKISTEGELIGFASLVNEYQWDSWKPTYFEDFKGVTIELENDIKLTKDWNAIGSDTEVCFRGTFDGNGHTISGLNIQTNSAKTGFFGYLEGTVKNLNLEGTVTCGNKEVGAVVAHLAPEGKIINCTANVAVSGKAKTGGICGYNDSGTISNCINFADVAGTIKVGGIVGDNWGIIRKCGNRGTIYSTHSGSPTFGTGGVAGRSVSEHATVRYCYNVGNIISMTDATGGVVGYANATGSSIFYCYNTGNVSTEKKKKSILKGTNAYAGGVVGVVGRYGISIKHCYNAGRVTSTGVAGGVIGKYYNEDADNNDKYIVNNLFANTTSYGIGSDYENKPLNISGGTRSTSTSSLVNADTSLGSLYKNDNSGSYGSNGFPVLSWQPSLINMDKTYLPHISITLQKNLDRYENSTKGQHKPGETILMYFDHNIFSSRALKDYSKTHVKQILKTNNK